MITANATFHVLPKVKVAYLEHKYWNLFILKKRLIQRFPLFGLFRLSNITGVKTNCIKSAYCQHVKIFIFSFPQMKNVVFESLKFHMN